MPAAARLQPPAGDRPSRSRPGTPPHGRRAADVEVPAWSVLTWGTARFAITAAATLLALAIGPAALGCRTVVVVSGSMQPRVWVGDVLVVRPLGNQLPHRGQVLLVDDPAHPGRQISHRLVRFNRDGTLTLKGDANPAPDSTPVPLSSVRGAAVLRVPLIGHPTIWRAQGRSLPLAATALLALSTGWIGLRPAPRGTTRRPAASRRSRTGAPAGRHKKDSGRAATLVLLPSTAGVDVVPNVVPDAVPDVVPDVVPNVAR